MRRDALLLLVVSFIVLAALGLWLTRPGPAHEPEPAPAEPVAESNAPAPKPERHSRSATVASDAGQPLAASAPVATPTPPPTAAPAQREHPLEKATETATRPGEEQPRGTVDKEAIRAAIKSVSPLVKQCFTDAADRYPPPQKVVLKFTITGQGISGHFTDGEVVESTIVDPWVQSCFLESLVDARFPAPEGGEAITVTYPFAFGAAAPTDAGAR